MSWNKGKPWSPAMRKKISESLQGRIPWNKGKKGMMPIPHNKGKHLSQKTKDKIAASRKGQSSWNAGLHWDDATKEKIRASQKKRYELKKTNPIS